MINSTKSLIPPRILDKNHYFYKQRYETEEYFLQNCENGGQYGGIEKIEKEKRRVEALEG